MAPQDDSGASVASSVLSSPPESIFDPKEDIDTLLHPVVHENSGIAEQLQKIGVSAEGQEEGEQEEDNLDDTGASVEVNMEGKRPRQKTTLFTAKRLKMRSKKWDPDFLLEDPSSVLTKVDLRALLSHPDAWAVLTAEEKKEVLAEFPDDQHILDAGTENARPNIQSLRNDDNFRHDVARFRDAISNGQLDPQWLQEAWVAHERRETGEFDEYKIKMFESDWGVELPAEYKTAQQAPQQQSDMPSHNSDVGALDELSGGLDVKDEVVATGANGDIPDVEKHGEETLTASTEKA